jgi:predicted metal-dependent hydrolase
MQIHRDRTGGKRRPAASWCISEIVAAANYREPMTNPVESVRPPRVEVRRSRRRTKTVSAYRERDAIVVLIPARLTREEEEQWVSTMVDRVTRAERRRRRSDADLVRRARELSGSYLNGRAEAYSVRWVDNQRLRWGSCTPADASIRVSSRVRAMPPYVVDYVLLHELAHLLVHGHGADFWRLVNRYPMAERARGYLEGVSATAGLDMAADTDDEFGGNEFAGDELGGDERGEERSA